MNTPNTPVIPVPPQKSVEEYICEIVQTVMSLHDDPLIPSEVIVKDHLEKGDTAYFDFITNRTHVSRSFVREMNALGGIPMEEAVHGILTHEIGHYVRYPHECSVLMYLGHLGKPLFKEFNEEVLGYWVDVMDNLPMMLKENHGKSLRSLYRGMNKVLDFHSHIPEKERELLDQILRALGKNPEEVITAARTYSVDRLLIAYYQKQTGDNLGIDVTGEYLEQKLLGEEMVINGKKERRGGLMDIDFTKKEYELANFTLFGTIVMEILKKRRESLPQIKIPIAVMSEGNGKRPDEQGNSGTGNQNKGIGGSGWTTGDPELDKLLEKLYEPILGDAPTLRDFSEDQLNEGLDDIIRKHGKGRYERIRDYVERVTGRKLDPGVEGKNRSDGVGLGSSQISLHDDQIPYYVRLASTYGLYIHRKPMVTDVTSNYPEGSQKFRVGDPIKTLNPYSTGGHLLPGITKRHTLKHGTKQDRLYKVPDLTIWLDTSGSMGSPEQGSHAVLAAFILARNYHKNGSKVGVCNFSADMALLLPTRDMETVNSMLCAYWGGGTVLNIEKVKEYMKRIAEAGGGTRGKSQNVVYTTEKEYEPLISRLDPEERKQFLEKNLEIKLKGRLKETYERMDTIMITDGGIANIREVVDYINSTAHVSRNTIFLMKGGWHDESWVTMDLPNTQVIPVAKKEDLRGLAIGKAKKLVPPSVKPTSLFGK